MILNREDYDEKMATILNDSTKFRQLNCDPLKETMRRETKLRNFLKKLKNEHVITDEIYKKIAPTGSKPGILYGLPKVHKANTPLRPILSAIGTISYQISKYLVPTLRPISSSPFVIPDTFSFVDDLRNLTLDNDNVFMASFDVSSLFYKRLTKPLTLLLANFTTTQRTALATLTHNYASF